jgi:hypothetical protein
MGTGGAPEGVLTAAAMRCLNGEIFARLVVGKPEHEERCRAMGITDFKRIYRSRDLAPGERIVFAATGVTDGTIMRGVRFFGDGTRTSSVIMQNTPHQIRFIDSIHISNRKDAKVYFGSIERCAGSPSTLPAGRCSLQEAAAVIKAGGIVAMPTDTLYGLAADPFSPAAVERVFAAKGRAAERALPLVAADIAQVEEQLGALPPDGRRLAAAYWPGPLTLLLPRPSTMPEEVTGGLSHVGVRVPAHAVAGTCAARAGELRPTTRHGVLGVG